MPRREAFESHLQAAGFTAAMASVKADVLQHCDRALDAMGAVRSARISVWVPGRIELFGKHTDYAGGRSLLTAVDRGFCVRAAPRADQLIRVAGYDPLRGVSPSDAVVSCELLLSPRAAADDGDWSNYVATVARRVAVNFPDATTGVDIAFVSDLPPAAGASSSTALMISVFLAISAVNRLDESERWRTSITTREHLAGYLGAMEMGGPFGELAGLPGVGTLGGSQDQTAILCAESGRVIDYRWMPVQRIGAYPLADDYRIVVAHSGVVAEKSAGARERYNRVSLMVRHLLASWNAQTGRADHSLAAAVESGAEAADTLRAMLPTMATRAFSMEALRNRLEQFLLETYTIVPAAAAAIAAADWHALSDVAARSQQAAEAWLGNQVAETSGLVSLARAAGALAASAFGAGFGGSVWALIPAARVGADDGGFETRWAAAYRQEFPAAAERAMFFATAAGPAAMLWADDARSSSLPPSSVHV